MPSRCRRVPAGRCGTSSRTWSPSPRTWSPAPGRPGHRADGEREFHVGSGDRPRIGLVTSPFEAFRFRMGRRSRGQLAAMAWSGDPTPVLGRLTIFGPSEADIVE